MTDYRITAHGPAIPGNRAGLEAMIGSRKQVTWMLVEDGRDTYHLLITDRGEVFSWLDGGWFGVDWCPL